MYKEAGFIFPQTTKKRIEDVLEFHNTVIKNRKEYLLSETQRIRQEMDKQEKETETISNKRAILLLTLQTHGALEEYSQLQNRLSSIKQSLEEKQNKISDIKKIEQGRSDIKIKKESLAQKARQDKEERKDQIDKVIKLFNQNSEFLYSQPGNFSINITDSGYKFNVEILRSGSQGINYMKVFTYDITVAMFRAGMRNPGFVIHDSTIFDGVDERQVAKALELAAKACEDLGIQYICTMNSDNIPKKEFTEGFLKVFNESIRITFTDDKENGGLLGFRF
jgi:uncharacterized protein YydD (DUF2326 family)